SRSPTCSATTPTIATPPPYSCRATAPSRCASPGWRLPEEELDHRHRHVRADHRQLDGQRPRRLLARSDVRQLVVLPGAGRAAAPGADLRAVVQEARERNTAA